jgi:hypothetical protein
VEVPSPAPTPAKGTLDDIRCNNAMAVSTEWKQKNDVVLGYVQKLGEIAGVDVQPSFAPLGSALQSGNFISSTQNTAFQNLANDLSKQIIAGDLRQMIADTVTDVNPDFKTAVEALKQVDGAYGQMLNSEYNETYAYYHCLIAYEMTQKPSKTPFDFKPKLQSCPSNAMFPAEIPLTLREQILEQRLSFTTSLNNINQRSTASIEYARVLDSMEQTHETLYEAATRQATLKDYVAQLQTTIIPLYRDVDALAKAVK